eukprot:CAMPEP_0177710550 /NCGR_PEP_ID=MMETSP0484_2-20121128/11394_1 /TAXON_ID=354590 /ORGANISM="Rhodomonas lens, Strain RHODO" /LENGTH=92 /DNA_ID=CAMNT_0019222237 /DNA_START=7 /DNA_END=285 /DNA_ORIENTATION=+
MPMLSLIPLIMGRGGATMLIPDPEYEAYVSAAGIDGNTDWHVDDNHSCGNPPCSAGWDYPAAKYAPSALPFSQGAPPRVTVTVGTGELDLNA